eukprot:2874459-Prymnesium_polylepis.1
MLPLADSAPNSSRSSPGALPRSDTRSTILDARPNRYRPARPPINSKPAAFQFARSSMASCTPERVVPAMGV